MIGRRHDGQCGCGTCRSHSWAQGSQLWSMAAPYLSPPVKQRFRPNTKGKGSRPYKTWQLAQTTGLRALPRQIRHATGTVTNSLAGPAAAGSGGGGDSSAVRSPSILQVTSLIHTAHDVSGAQGAWHRAAAGQTISSTLLPMFGHGV